MSKIKFEAVKELIDEKCYGEARAVLKTMDSPTAREWERKMDERGYQLESVTKQSSRGNFDLYLLLSFLVVLVIFLVASFIQAEQSRIARAECERRSDLSGIVVSEPSDRTRFAYN